MSNKESGQQLVINTERPASNHIEHIYAKIDGIQPRPAPALFFAVAARPSCRTRGSSRTVAPAGTAGLTDR